MRSPRGISLVEVTVASALLAIVITLIISLSIEGGRTQDYTTQQADRVAAAQTALRALTETIQETTDGDDGSYGITEAADFSLTIYSDTDADGSTEQVQFFLDETSLKQVVTETTGTPVETTIIENVINQSSGNTPLFYYYDGDNNLVDTTIELSSVELIQIILKINANPIRIPNTDTIDTSIQLRNLNKRI